MSRCLKLCRIGIPGFNMLLKLECCSGHSTAPRHRRCEAPPQNFVGSSRTTACSTTPDRDINYSASHHFVTTAFGVNSHKSCNAFRGQPKKLAALKPVGINSVWMYVSSLYRARSPDKFSTFGPKKSDRLCQHCIATCLTLSRYGSARMTQLD
jgi:hypothetical protein